MNLFYWFWDKKKSVVSLGFKSLFTFKEGKCFRHNYQKNLLHVVFSLNWKISCSEAMQAKKVT